MKVQRQAIARAVPNGRKASVLPGLLCELGWWFQLAECLTRPSFLAASVAMRQGAAWETAAAVASARRAAIAAATGSARAGDVVTGFRSSSGPPDAWMEWESRNKLQGAGASDPGSGAAIWKLVASEMGTSAAEAAARLLPWERFLARHAADLARRPWLFPQACLNDGSRSAVRMALTGSAHSAGSPMDQIVSVSDSAASGSMLPTMSSRLPMVLRPRAGTRLALRLTDPLPTFCEGVVPARTSVWVRGLAVIPGTGSA